MRVIVIGGSAGGIEAIRRLLAGLPPDFAAAVLIAQHVGRRSGGHLPEILRCTSSLPVMHPYDGQRIEEGVVYVAPPDHHMVVGGGTIGVNQAEAVHHCRPSIDVLFRSAAEWYGPSVIGVVLSGYLSDGTAGLLAIKNHGGIAIVQDPRQAPASSMVTSALAHVPIDHVCNVEQIAPLLVDLVANRRHPGMAQRPDQRL